MPRTNRLTSALAGRGKAAAAVAAAAAVLAGAGTASAATIAAPAKTAADAELRRRAGRRAARRRRRARHPCRHDPQPRCRSRCTCEARRARCTCEARCGRGRQDLASCEGCEGEGSGRRRRRRRPARPFEVYDSVTPSQIPAGARLATYADGGYAVAPSQVADRGHVLWIDTSGSDPRAAALDVEPGDATPGQAATWAWHKLHNAAGSVAIIYTMRSEWAATQAAVATLPASMQHHVRWWIADPTGVPHIVPGADATQWYWGHNYDITTARPGSGM